ncbi:MAG: hypothetical protein KDB27_35420, partial [Planctomycetales bacterium]|nr:hypothetical protein [Planctomycetales bacterium]
IREAPDSIRDAVKRFDYYSRGCGSYGEFRWSVFQHIRSESIATLETFLEKLYGDPVGGTHIKSYLERGLNDADWPIAFHEDTPTEFWKLHQAGIAAVRDYIGMESSD